MINLEGQTEQTVKTWKRGLEEYRPQAPLKGKLKLNSRGQFDVARKSIYWTIAGIVITIVILAFAIIMSQYQNNSLQVPPQLRAELISLRFVNTPECFTYQDPVSGRIFPGVIDLNKFTQEGMDLCYRTEKEKGFNDYNFGLQLAGFNPIDEEGKESMLRTNNFFNKVDFTLYKDVFVRVGEELVPSQMTIYVQTKI